MNIPDNCRCGERLADACPGEWQPGCDLGANDKHARPASPAQVKAIQQALGFSRNEVESIRKRATELGGRNITPLSEVLILCQMAEDLFELRDAIPDFILDATRYRTLREQGACHSKSFAGFTAGTPAKATVSFRYWCTPEELDKILDNTGK